MSREQKPRPFDLPPSPIDRYRVEWWTVSSRYGNDYKIRHIEAVYYVNAKWAEVCPDDDHPGADFVNHWRILENGFATARTRDGWAEAFDGYPWDDEFSTEKAAIEEAIRRLRERQEHLIADAAQCRMSVERHFERLREIRDAGKPAA